uniref:Arf-GAP with dual PH domain-containing protein 1 n=1 Tax=Phallusia mammillata TaxID=59560 RepID=A0A6F9D6P2_9ASCI|nr:Arf-GAP with dual PH domain-containing protein 1 [Phallusia mammillata]
MGERNKKILLELLQKPGNNICADCSSDNPEWASSNIGVFICVNCSGIHRMLGTHVSRVKSCRLDQWADDAVQMMCESGNDAVNAILERYIPVYYKKPSPSDPQVYKEHFIHAKYDRKEFETMGGTAHYETGTKTGKLWKRGKEDKQFKPRKFVLNTEEGTLKYYIKDDAKEPKQTIPLASLSATLAPEKINHPNGLQFAFKTDNLTRQIYVYADEGKDTGDWYITLRASAFNILRKTYPGIDTDVIMDRLNSHQGKEGWMMKTGPKHTEAYRRRWFTLEKRKLLYFANPLDAYPKGEIYLGSGTDGFMVRDGLPAGQNEQGFGITITTPERDYLLCCEDQEEQRSWIGEIKNIMTKPLTSQDTADLQDYKLTYQHRRKSTIRNNLTNPTGWR